VVIPVPATDRLSWGILGPLAGPWWPGLSHVHRGQRARQPLRESGAGAPRKCAVRPWRASLERRPRPPRSGRHVWGWRTPEARAEVARAREAVTRGGPSAIFCHHHHGRLLAALPFGLSAQDPPVIEKREGRRHWETSGVGGRRAYDAWCEAPP